MVATNGSSLAEVGAQLRQLASQIESYLANIPAGDRYFPPIIDWHHPDEYAQNGVQGLSKFLHHVAKESAIVDALLESPSPPIDYSTNLVSLQGVWDAFVRAPRPLVGVWQAMDSARAGRGPASVKVDVVAAGGDEWVKINTIKESRLLVEFREHDSYINSDYDSDSDPGSENGNGAASGPGAEMTNSLIKQARALVDAAAAYGRIPGLNQPRIRYVLTRLEENPAGGYADSRIPATFDAMRDLGIQLEFATQWGDELAPLLQAQKTEALPAPDIVLDLSVLIALCCDSTHYPLPQNEDELEKRFRLLAVSRPDHASAEEVNGTGKAANGGANGASGHGARLAPHTGATRDLRDQLRCEMARPLVQELQERLDAAGIVEPRFWCTREVYSRLPGLVEVIGGAAERRRAKVLFDPSLGDFWEGSRWQGNTGCLTSIRVRLLDEETVPDSPGAWAPFDTVVAHICERMVASAGDASPPARESTPGPTKPIHFKKKKDPEPGFKTTKTVKNKNKNKPPNPSRNPLRPGTYFPPSSRLPSGHTLRTLLAGIRMRATVLTNNRGAVLKVMREAGVTDGIPSSDGIPSAPGSGTDAETRARVWVVNPSSLAEWRRIEVEENNRRIAAEANM